MKYMGSKRSMLRNGLGALISRELADSKRFVDLFTGSAAVAWFAATRHPVEVYAFDLQSYGMELANAVLRRRTPLDGTAIWAAWEKVAERKRLTLKPPTYTNLTQQIVKNFRNWCAAQGRSWVITRSYGGHYFSPEQAVWFDALRSTLPDDRKQQSVALAALIQAASECAAAPGHTAQPFQPTKGAKPFLRDAWQRDVPARVKNALLTLSATCAKRVGLARVKDANKAARTLRKGDVVFVDPPYSGVHYSRFYHVLETIAEGKCGRVSGRGRYPARKYRPTSDYSISTKSVDALDELLDTLSRRKTRVILTFPDHKCSNGLSGYRVRKLASKYFEVQERSVGSRFSTLGGSGSEELDSDARAARQSARELILVMRPRPSKRSLSKQRLSRR